MEALTSAGLGLAYDDLQLVPVRPEWAAMGRDLATAVAAALGPLAEDVVHVGSTAVPEMLAKPIIDLAIGVGQNTDSALIEAQLVAHGWIYRGDAGDQGGQIYVLESAPWFRVAHAHGVAHLGPQWNRYLRFRDLLRSDAAARNVYGDAKLSLLTDLPDENRRKHYTDSKSPVIRRLLSDAVPQPHSGE